METNHIAYLGERLWAGEVGNIFVIVSFAAALLSSISYFFSANAAQNSEEEASWKKIARFSYLFHTLSVFGMVGILFFMLIGHYFEYQYIWQHSNSTMPLRYIASCFWEGQEGSFLLWIFWNSILGSFLMKRAKEWEAPVLATVSLVQVFLCSMLLGIYVFDYKVGSNPFTILLREHPDFKNLPFVQNADYLKKIDGRGLNPLLQNYWMVIHPPTLFLGFSLTVVPFAFAIAGLWKKKYNDWQKPALQWTFLGIMVLGTGVLMGGAWAYEALSFGGFWAWDPVENASLVPWLTLVGAGHVMLIHKSKGQSLFATFLLSLITFLLILYSTFLTRSGILGESSVHAFTDLGMSGQLLVYLFVFLAIAIILLSVNYKNLPKQEQEESILSREFWMLVGALVLLISAFQISFTTSIPVFNKIFNTHLAVPAEGKAFTHYHQWQIPFSIIITLLIGVGQYLKYKKTDVKEFLKKISIPIIAAFVCSILAGFSFQWFKQETIFYLILFFSALFTIFANLGYIVLILKGKLDHGGASVAHIGFGMILLGALISTARSEKISINQRGDVEVLGKDFSNQSNILLQRNDTVKMGDYYILYKGKRKEKINVFYDIEYLDSSKKHSFMLSPRIQLNERMGNVAEPDTKHELRRDIYTHVTYADLSNINENQSQPDFNQPINNTLSVGDTFFTINSFIILEKLNVNIDKANAGIPNADIAVGAQLRVLDVFNKSRITTPIFYITDSIPNTIETKIDDLGLKFAFWNINPEAGKVDIAVSEKKSNNKDFIVMTAIVFPYINILWSGCLIMIIGTSMAIRRRIKNIL